MDLDISGKLALVTGAGRGFGRAIVKQLASEGVTVIAASRSIEPLESLHNEISPNTTRHHIISVDLMKEKAPSNMIKSIIRDIGDPDIVVHNLGGSLGVTDPVSNHHQWQNVWQLNLGIPIEINSTLIPLMTHKEWGRIVLVSSNATLTYQGYPAYVSAKAAQNAYVKTLGRALAKDNVIVSSVMPGPIYAEDRYLGRLQAENPDAWEEYVRNHLPIGRLGQAEELAPFVAILCSELASFAAGSIIPVDGGSM